MPDARAQGGTPGRPDRSDARLLEARASRALAESPLPTVLLARDLHVEFWNRAAEALFG